MNCIIYPCSDLTAPYIRFMNQVSGKYNIVKAVCPKICRASVNDDLGCEITTDFNVALDECETLIICDNLNNLYMYDDLIAKMNLAFDNGKNVICCTELRDSDVNELNEKAKKNNISFEYLKSDVFDFNVMKVFERQECIVIGLGNALTPMNSDKIFCEVIQKFSKIGYKTIGIGNSRNNALINGYSFPEKIFTMPCTDSERVLMLNKFINDVELRHCPDIIVVQFPNGMVNFMEEIIDGYNIRPYILSKAVQIDYFILNIPVFLTDPASLDEYITEFNYKYGVPLRGLVVSDFEIDVDASFDSGEASVIQTEKKYVYEYIDMCRKTTNKFIICDSDSSSDFDNLVNDCIEELSGAIEEL